MTENPFTVSEKDIERISTRARKKMYSFLRKYPESVVSAVLSVPVAVDKENHIQHRSNLILCCGDACTMTEGFLAGLGFILSDPALMKEMLELFHDRFSLDMENTETLQEKFIAFCLLLLELTLKQEINMDTVASCLNELRESDKFSAAYFSGNTKNR